MYPDKTSKEREYAYAKLKGAIFISQIGKALASGEKHDGRAPDYDDWELNGDVIVYYPVSDYCTGAFFHGYPSRRRFSDETVKDCRM